jgi:hypothetical protein
MGGPQQCVKEASFDFRRGSFLSFSLPQTPTEHHLPSTKVMNRARTHRGDTRPLTSPNDNARSPRRRRVTNAEVGQPTEMWAAQRRGMKPHVGEGRRTPAWAAHDEVQRMRLTRRETTGRVAPSRCGLPNAEVRIPRRRKETRAEAG